MNSYSYNYKQLQNFKLPGFRSRCANQQTACTNRFGVAMGVANKYAIHATIELPLAANDARPPCTRQYGSSLAPHILTVAD